MHWRDQHEQQCVGKITALPVDIVCVILSAITDVPSLYSAARASKVFNNVLQEYQSSITTTVLLNQISKDVMPEAVAAYRVAKLMAMSSEDSESEQIIRALQTRPAVPQQWTFPEALPLGRLHTLVEYFTARFTEEALVWNPDIGGAQYPPTHTELSRIQRTLYRFETFCRFWRKNQDDVYSPRNQAFWSRTAPWENEQLNCIFHFLGVPVSKAYNEVAMHNIHWGANRVPYHDGEDFEGHAQHAAVQPMLSLGLEAIYPFTIAQTYEERARLWKADECLPEETRDFLSRAFHVHHRPPVQDDGQPTPVKSVYCSETDTGPEEAWRVVYPRQGREPPNIWLDYPEFIGWSSVMWDSARLDGDRAPLSAEPNPDHEIRDDWVGFWKESPPFVRRDPALPLGADLPESTMDESWMWRERIYDLGGRGFWSFHDDSKTVWTRGKVEMKNCCPWSRDNSEEEETDEEDSEEESRCDQAQNHSSPEANDSE